MISFIEAHRYLLIILGFILLLVGIYADPSPEGVVHVGFGSLRYLGVSGLVFSVVGFFSAHGSKSTA